MKLPGTYLIEKAKLIQAKIESELDELILQLTKLPDVKCHNFNKESKHVLKEKEFISRQSKLTSMMVQSDIRTILNIFIAVLVIYSFSVLIDQYIYLDRKNIELLSWAFGGWSSMFKLYSVMILNVALILPIQKLYFNNRIPGFIYIIFYVIFQITLLIAPPIILKNIQLEVANTYFILLEMARLGMKLHSFFRETQKLYDPTSDSNKYNIITFRHFIYFLFVPTLLFRMHYPRTPRIRFRMVIVWLIEAIACLIFISITYNQSFLPEFTLLMEGKQGHGDWLYLIISVFNLAVPAVAIFLFMFFGIFHCWLNAFAELTRFADRQFYQDWWNTRSWSAYFRKWNIVVHDWLYQYLYLDVVRYFRIGATPALLFSFLFSALIHEYIVSIAFGFFYPVLFVIFGCFGVGFTYLTRIYKGAYFWNVFFWTMMFFGLGVLTVLYSREYYCLQKPVDPLVDMTSWLPCSWQLMLLL